MNEPGKHKRRKGLQNFRYALEGWRHAWTYERHIKVHTGFALMALILAYIFELSKFDFLFVLLASALVIVTELINTAVERAVDMAQPNFHPLAKVAKDAAAAAVLVSAVFAVMIGIIVFYEPVCRLVERLY